MDRKFPHLLYRVLPGLYMLAAFLYIIFVIRPVFYFHHVQPPFLLTFDFFVGYLKETGGLSRYLSLLFLQAFYSPILGPIVLFSLAAVIWALSLQLLNRLHQNRSNVLLALFPFTLALVLLNNYNFPFSVLVSVIFVLLFLWLLSAWAKTRGLAMIFYTAGALGIYFISGAGFLLLYSLCAIFLSVKGRERKSLLAVVWIGALAFLLPFMSGSEYFWFFPSKPNFMAYEPSSLFYIFLLSLPLLLLLLSLHPRLWMRMKFPALQLAPAIFLTITALALIGLALFSHLLSFRPDAKKIVASDYYCYHHDAERTARAATSMENYSFAANVNYNLVLSKNGTLSQNFFDFFQIRGSDALFPDVDFSAEILFIAADFYYELGYISEARHNAYEALVFYPYSARALQLLLKVHLVNGEYKAADKCLRILDKGLVSRKVVEAYRPLVEDPSLIATNGELLEKRSFIPAEKELSHFIDQRFRDLLEANPANRLAYEYLMLYHLLEGDLESFLQLYQEAGIFFDDLVEIYEEAILMYGMMTLTKDVAATYQVSKPTLDRFAEFGRLVEQHEGDPGMARNVLYWEMGQSYFYYLGYLHPRIVKPERVKEEYDEAPI